MQRITKKWWEKGRGRLEEGEVRWEEGKEGGSNKEGIRREEEKKGEVRWGKDEKGGSKETVE